jgi:predicted component of type VI protein secretion system
MKVRLQITYADGCTLSVEQHGPMLRIGRNPDNELAVVDESCGVVSWQHAEIEMRPEGAFLRDLKSLNGTFIEDLRVDGRVPLTEGQQIRLGHTGPMIKVLAVELTGPGQPEAPRRAGRPESRPPMVATSADMPSPVAVPTANPRPGQRTSEWLASLLPRFQAMLRWRPSNRVVVISLLFLCVLLSVGLVISMTR